MHIYWPHHDYTAYDTSFTLLQHYNVDHPLTDEEVMLSNSVISAQILLDISAEINLISQHFVIEHQLFSMKGELSQPQFLDRQKAYCFKAYWVKYCLTDNWKQTQDCEYIFYSLNKTESALLLELSALITENIQSDCETKTWHFNIEEQSIEIQSSVNFTEKIKDYALTVYIILWVRTVEPSSALHI